MTNQSQNLEVIAKDKKIILKSEIKVEIPVMQIMWVKLGEKPSEILIETVAGINISFDVEPKERQKTKDIIQKEWLKFFKQRHGLKSDN